MVRLVSVNAFNLYGGTDPEQEYRFGRLEAAIRGLDADIVAVQEIVGGPPTGTLGKAALAELGARRLAEAVDRRCEVDGSPVCAVGGGIHHTALLWREGIEPVPGTVRRFGREDAGLWHSLVTCVFDIGGPRLRVGSVQLSPFDQAWGWSDAAQILRAMNSDDVAGLQCGDYNGIGADAAYDPDPYAAVEWRPDHAYQFDEHGRLDRRVAQRLEGPGRMRDCARIVGVPWARTSGHFPQDAHPDRRVDRWYATHHLPDAALVGHWVAPLELVRMGSDGWASDHLPVGVEVDERALIR